MKPTLNILSVAMIIVLPISAAHAQNLSPQDREKLIENITQSDTNSDGALTYAEFERLINLNADDGLGRAEMVRRMGRYSMAFNRLDANGDGFLTKGEMQSMAQRAGR